MRKAVLLFVTSAMLAGAFPGMAMAQPLQTVVRKTLDTNPELQAFFFNRRAIDQELEAAKGLGLPGVDVRAGAGHRTTDQSLAARGLGLTGSDGYRSRNRFEAGVSVTQRLFDGFEREHQVSRQANRVESARHRVLDAANSVALQAVQAYLEVLRAQRVVAVANGNLEAHQSILRKVRDRAENGRSPQAEIAQANARLEAARAAQAEAQGRLRDAHSLFIAVVGERPGRLTAPGAIDRRLPAGVDQAVAAAQKGSPAIIARMFDAYAAADAIGIARSEFFPKLTAEAGVDHTYDADPSNGRRTDAYGMVVLRQNLYRGGIDTARTREAMSRTDEAMALRGQTARSVEREVRLSWSAIQTARARAAAIGRQLDQNRQVIVAYNEQFALGQRSLLDILDVQNEIFVNESVLETERFVADFNSYRVIAAMGDLVRALGLDQPQDGTRGPDRKVHPIPKSSL